MDTISDNQLAYLNANLDLICKYARLRARSEDYPFDKNMQVLKVKCTNCRSSLVHMYIKTPTVTLVHNHEWRHLLQYVEANGANQPPIFK